MSQPPVPEPQSSSENALQGTTESVSGTGSTPEPQRRLGHRLAGISEVNSDAVPLSRFRWGPVIVVMVLLLGIAIGFYTTLKPARDRAEFKSQLTRVSKLFRVFLASQQRGPADVEEIEAIHRFLMSKSIPASQIDNDFNGTLRLGYDATEALGPIDLAIQAIREGRVVMLWNAHYDYNRLTKYQYVGFEATIDETESMVLLLDGSVAYLTPREFAIEYFPLSTKPPPPENVRLRSDKLPESVPVKSNPRQNR